MNWNLDNLTPKQEEAIRQFGYIGAFCSVILPRLKETEPPKGEPTPPDTSAPKSTYIPLAHQECETADGSVYKAVYTARAGATYEKVPAHRK